MSEVAVLSQAYISDDSNPRGKWNTADARAAFRTAFFDDAYDKPSWMRGIALYPEPHDADRPTATITCVGRNARIKILPSYPAVDNFWRQYPDATVVVLVVKERDHPADIRRKVFRQLADLL